MVATWICLTMCSEWNSSLKYVYTLLQFQLYELQEQTKLTLLFWNVNLGGKTIKKIREVFLIKIRIMIIQRGECLIWSGRFTEGVSRVLLVFFLDQMVLLCSNYSLNCVMCFLFFFWVSICLLCFTIKITLKVQVKLLQRHFCCTKV